MENYEEFIRNRRCRLKEAKTPLNRGTSEIRFFGRSVLPPLLNTEQREEMTSHRELAHLRECQKSALLPILHRSTPRQATPLEELAVADGGGPSDQLAETKSCGQTRDWKVVGDSRPLTSTARSDVTHFQDPPGDDAMRTNPRSALSEAVTAADHQTGRGEEPKAETLDDVSHQSVSSGYITGEIVATVVHSGTQEEDSMSHGMERSSQGEASFSFCLFQTDGYKSDIISHAPVDGGDLEREAAECHTDPACSLAPQDPLKSPYQMSLQSLLKKSQEHRRQQRMLKSQAKASKAAEAASLDDHHSSNKQIEEFAEGCGVVRTEPRGERRREQKSFQACDLETVVSEGIAEVEFCERENVLLTKKLCEARWTDCSESEKIICDNTTGPSSSSNNHHQPIISNSLQALKLAKGKKSHPGVSSARKFCNIPTPQFCLSPVRCKKSGMNGRLTKRAAGRTRLCVEDELQNNPISCWDPKMLPKVTGGSLCLVSDQTQQIAELELSLSNLKAYISVLESTLTEVQKNPSDGPREASAQHSDQDIPPCHPSTAENEPPVISLSDCGSRPDALPLRTITSLGQKMRVVAPAVFGVLQEAGQCSQRGVVLADASNLQERRSAAVEEKRELKEDSPRVLSLNQSYDVDSPSGLWLQLTPKPGDQERGSRAKRRLLMNISDENAGSPFTIYKAVQSPVQEIQKLKLKHAHLEQAGVEQRKQQQVCGSLSLFHCPLVAAAVKGYLTRRLLRTERVAQLVRTIKDTQQFSQTQTRCYLRTRQDVALQKRVSLQLRSARYDLHDIFRLSAADRMQLIAWDRELLRERQFKRMERKDKKVCLSTATRKYIERKRGAMLKNPVVERRPR
ncbi:uncharacterized protein cp110 isoform X2 [Denticeps clupeoides]|uniref:Centriolar coiled-coil protein 110 n=1 Tax=Denticeps clupeoides TaxID=299321 RepID=A0AAY4EFC2_9TELE|nr:uncharacterized protein LOC114786537 isoform X2 [Denticeps clupeoides]